MQNGFVCLFVYLINKRVLFWLQEMTTIISTPFFMSIWQDPCRSLFVEIWFWAAGETTAQETVLFWHQII